MRELYDQFVSVYKQRINSLSQDLFVCLEGK